MLANIVMVLGSYLLGALPVLLFIGRVRGFDLSEEEDLHMALWRKVGRLEGVLGILWDLGKGAICVLIVRALGFGLPAVATAGVAVVAGQMWPVFSRFDGEKGNSTGLAMALALAPIPLLIALIPILVGVIIRTAPRFFRSGQSVDERLKFGGPPSLSLPLAMAVGFAVLPLASWWLHEAGAVIIAFFVLFVLIIIRRVTADLRKDLEGAPDKKSILINRFLYDRSYL